MRNQPNEELRRMIRKVGHQWQIADAMGVHEVTLIRLLRHPLDDESTKRVMEAIEKLTAQNTASMKGGKT